VKERWLQLLCDPDTSAPLRLARVVHRSGDRILEGELEGSSGRRFPIRDGVPVFVGEGAQPVQSVASFAYEWNTFGFLFAREGWIEDIVRPLVGGTEFFRGKTVVDAGAGSGAQSRWMAEAGANLVISLELSDAVFGVHRQTTAGLAETVFPVQCDIARSPIAVTPDVLYCVNVLQHTSSPTATFGQLSRMVGERTTFLFNVYTKRSRAKSAAVGFVRRCIRPLPFALWKWAAFAIAAVGYPIGKVRAARPAVRFFIPLSHSFRETWLDVYDAFEGHWYQTNLTMEEQLSMFRDAGLRVALRAPYGLRLERIPDA
jgi:uncharacterized protein YbaR (Trm112 family)